MKNNFKYLLWTALFISVVSCGLFKKKNAKGDEHPVARVYDTYLYPSDLAGVGKGATKPEDSINAVKNYIDSWIRHQLLLHYAEDNLPETNDEIERQLKDYKESLMISNYEKELIAQKMDTTVSKEAIKKFYEANKNIFLLKAPIVKMKYIMLSTATKVRLDSARNWLKHATTFNQPQLKDFIQSYAVKHSISDTTWFRKDDAEKILPAGKFDFETAIYNKSYAEVNDSNYLFMIKFDDFKFDGYAPIDFVKREIVNIIMNERTNQFINKSHESIYNEALNGNKFEVYK